MRAEAERNRWRAMRVHEDERQEGEGREENEKREQDNETAEGGPGSMRLDPDGEKACRDKEQTDRKRQMQLGQILFSLLATCNENGRSKI